MVETPGFNERPRRTRPLKAFAIYAPADQAQYEDLRTQLATLKRSDLVDIRDLNSIEAGIEKSSALEIFFRESDIFFLIISSGFFKSDDCFNLLKDLNLPENNERKTIALLLKHCDWETQIPPEIEILPSDRTPIPQGRNRDLVLRKVAIKIREMSIAMIAENLKKIIKDLEISLENSDDLEMLRKLQFYYGKMAYLYKLSSDKEESNIWLTKALEALEKITFIEPENPKNYDQTGSIYESLNQPEKASLSYDKGLKILPKNNKLLGKSGNLKEKMGRFDEALEKYEAILELLPENCVAWYEKGMALNRLGRKQEAIQSFRRALEINPRYRLAKYQQRLVYSTL
jgi:tetratricopeptide (TPR) repeat protein